MYSPHLRAFFQEMQRKQINCFYPKQQSCVLSYWYILCTTAAIYMRKPCMSWNDIFTIKQNNYLLFLEFGPLHCWCHKFILFFRSIQESCNFCSVMKDAFRTSEFQFHRSIHLCGRLCNVIDGQVVCSGFILFFFFYSCLWNWCTVLSLLCMSRFFFQELYWLQIMAFWTEFV